MAQAEPDLSALSVRTRRTRRSKPGIAGSFPVPEVFPVNSVGIVTARDRLTIHWSAAEGVEHRSSLFRAWTRNWPGRAGNWAKMRKTGK